MCDVGCPVYVHVLAQCVYTYTHEGLKLALGVFLLPCTLFTEMGSPAEPGVCLGDALSLPPKYRHPGSCPGCPAFLGVLEI